jgi:hypothetical protein
MGATSLEGKAMAGDGLRLGWPACKKGGHRFVARQALEVQDHVSGPSSAVNRMRIGSSKEHGPADIAAPQFVVSKNVSTCFPRHSDPLAARACCERPF